VFRAFLEADPTPPPGGGRVQPSQGLGASQQPFSSPGTTPSSVSKKLEGLKVGKHPANEFCVFHGFYFDTRKLNAGAECGVCSS